VTDALDRLKAALADRYAIAREIGAGGMATVYLAHDLKHDRDVALKVLRQELTAALGAERFHREIQIAAKLQHPNILPLHDSGEAGGFLYYVMPFVEGQSLRERLAREGALPVGDAVRILRDVVDALTEAHAHGVVHRDIKPENIMLRGHHALVTDFGVAKAVSEATGRQTLTTAGVALGTPAYMAPEQASADPHLDHRVDIYAVGAVAYELLTGRPVFMGTTPQMVLSAHVTDAPVPITKYREAVPRALEALVMRCLAKQPADRWQSAEELLPQLEALATPSGGITPTETAPVQAVAGRRRTLVGGVVAAVVVLIAIGFLVGQLFKSKPLRSRMSPELKQVLPFRPTARKSHTWHVRRADLTGTCLFGARWVPSPPVRSAWTTRRFRVRARPLGPRTATSSGSVVAEPAAVRGTRRESWVGLRAPPRCQGPHCPRMGTVVPTSSGILSSSLPRATVRGRVALPSTRMWLYQPGSCLDRAGRLGRRTES